MTVFIARALYDQYIMIINERVTYDICYDSYITKALCDQHDEN